VLSVRSSVLISLALAGGGYDPPVTDDPVLVLQIPRGSALARGIEQAPPAAVLSGDAVVEHGPVDAEGALEPPEAGSVVLSFSSPEALARESDEVHRVLTRSESGAPLVVVIEDAEELRDEELAAVVAAGKRTPLPVILRVIRGG
jgi:hypothetical protein